VATCLILTLESRTTHVNDITIADVLSGIKTDLAWRGPNGRGLGHIVLPREHAEYLHAWALKLVLAKDNLEAELDDLRKKSDARK
jgi:hypothetical protein